MPSAALLEAVAVTAELCGRVFSEPAARVFVADLGGYPEASVMKALSRCRREVRGALTVADVVSRLDDGRPGPEEAWSMLPRTEAQTVVWTDEMAFKEAYQRLVSEARDAGKPVNWSASLGHDKLGREAALLDAVRMGRLELERARDYAPSLPAPDKRVMQLLGRT
jgi:hypothetical protein